MWILGIIILGVSCGVIQAQHAMCRQSDTDRCLPSGPLTSFPVTEEELEEACAFYRRFLACIVEYRDNCGFRKIETVYTENGKLDMLIDTHREICQPTTSLHSSFVANLPCFEDIYENDFTLCQERTSGYIHRLHSTLASKKSSSNNSLFKMYDCLFIILHTNCFAVQANERCGSRARNIVLEIIEKLGLVQEDCLEIMYDDVVEAMEILEFLTNEKIYVKKFLEKM
ncbi:uncharacterized protein CDAR_541641 [Caerostris darwini]|uniref:Uncharacterized protein n=1 Tax=Caerostris darwini TaxID=1538125 RepID=A0AAV4UU19_9ARAC|nr:uncharacterized protein CDAR_541641 [Caerostris darwini]